MKEPGVIAIIKKHVLTAIGYMIPLVVAAGLTKYAINKLSRDENVSTEVLGKICSALNCTTDDIMEFVPDEK